MRRIFIKKNLTRKIHLFWGGKKNPSKEAASFLKIPPFPSLKTSQTRETTIPYIILHSFPFSFIQILSLKCTVRF